MADSVDEILEKYKTLAVVGLSSQSTRPSFDVASYMQSHGYRIIPVNPNEVSVLGEKAYASLDDVPEPVEVVVIFRRSEYVPEVVEAAIRKQAKVIWMQEGVTHEVAAQRARAAGLTVVQDRCILKEHSRKIGDGRSKAANR
jgi:predicted CoA-binding protein